MWLVSRSLLWRMAALILLGAGLVLLLALGGSQMVLRKLVREQVRRENTCLTTASVYRMESQLAAAAAVVREVATVFPDLSGNRASTGPLITGTLEAHPDLFGMAVALSPEVAEDADFKILYGWRDDGEVRLVDRESPRIDYQQDWFYLSYYLQKPVWVDPYWDKETQALMVTYSAPVIERGQVTAVVTCDLTLTWIRDMLDELTLGEAGIAILLSRRGIFISHPQRDLEMRETIFSLAEALDDPDQSAEIFDLGQQMLSGAPGYKYYHRPQDGEPAYLYYRTVPATGWAMGVILPEAEVLAPLARLRRIGWGVGVTGMVFLLLAALAVAWSVARPLRALAGAADQLAQGDFDAQVPKVRSQDEIGRLTEAFNRMRIDLRRYIEELTETTAAKERIASELSIAREIQLGIVPKLFPPFPTRQDVDLYALLEPAREVGGDLYDFTLIDEDHLYIAVGDVSGKGVPASLMMAVGKTLLKSTILNVRDPARAMGLVNDELAEDNDSCMFITTFCGILNMKTGDLLFANGGHNPPLLARTDGKIEALRKLSGPALGGIPEIEFKGQSIRLAPGDMLTLYTDGVTEAMDPENVLYTDERLFDFVDRHARESAKDLALGIRDDVQKHAAGAEPSDDVTVLTLRFNGRDQKPTTQEPESDAPPPDAGVTVVNQREEIERLALWVEEHAEALRLPTAILMQINLVLEEWIVNVVSYAFEDDSRHEIELRFWRTPDSLKIEIRDDGRPFDPTAQAQADTTMALEQRDIGGLGIHFIRKTMDRVTYARDDDHNIVTLVKNLPHG